MYIEYGGTVTILVGGDLEPDVKRADSTACSSSGGPLARPVHNVRRQSILVYGV